MIVDLNKNTSENLLNVLSKTISVNNKTYLFMPYVFEVVGQGVLQIHSIRDLPEEFKEATSKMSESDLF